MKHTKWIWYVVTLALLFVVNSESVLALEFQRVQQNLQLVPSPTPTLVAIKKIDTNALKLITTNTPTPTTTVSITTTISPTDIPTITPTESVLGEQVEVTIEPTATNTPIATPTGKPTNTQNSNLTFWFLVVTIGLLATIIVVQAWPKKDGEE